MSLQSFLVCKPSPYSSAIFFIRWNNEIPELKRHKWIEWEKVNEVNIFCQETYRVSLLFTWLKNPNDSSSKYNPNFTLLIMWYIVEYIILALQIFIQCTTFNPSYYKVEIVVWPATAFATWTAWPLTTDWFRIYNEDYKICGKLPWYLNNWECTFLFSQQSFCISWKCVVAF